MVPEVLPFLNQEFAKGQERGAARRHQILEGKKDIAHEQYLLKQRLRRVRSILGTSPARTLLDCHGSAGL
eukprot:11044499-Prorocentrum_lima.AAC.1